MFLGVQGVPMLPRVPHSSVFPGYGFSPVSAKQKPNKKPKVPMKSLNWTKLIANIVRGTIWEKIDGTKIKFNPQEFCDLFGKT